MTDQKPPAEEHLIHVEDEEVVIEHHPEDWLAFVIFWSLAFIVFLQFFTRYVLNDSLAWTEEIARYGLMWIVFIGGAMVTRRNTHIAVELLSNVMKPGPARAALLALVDFVKLGFLGLLAYFSLTIIERMAHAAHDGVRAVDELRLRRRRVRLLPHVRAPGRTSGATRASGWQPGRDDMPDPIKSVGQTEKRAPRHACHGFRLHRGAARRRAGVHRAGRLVAASTRTSSPAFRIS